MAKRFAYWSVADAEYAKMMETSVVSARAAGIVEDFHVWTDETVRGAVCHPSGVFDKNRYMFKFKFLRDEVSRFDYDYFVFIDADNYFVRHPGQGTFDRLLRDNKWFVQLESDCTSPFVKREDWWGCPIRWYSLLLRYHGVTAKRIYNTNAGFWIVRKEAIAEFCSRGIEFFEYCRNELHLVNFTEEPSLAYLGHFVDDPEQNTLCATSSVWASDWTGHFNDRLPDGRSWQFEDYMSGERHRVNPAIVHAMRSKEAMIRGKQ